MLKKLIKINVILIVGLLIINIYLSLFKTFFARQLWNRQLLFFPHIISIIGLFIGVICIKRRLIKINVDRLIGFICIMLIPIQIYLVTIYYLPNYNDAEFLWDARVVLTDAIHIADQNYQFLDNRYFSIYPNNIFAVYIFSKIISLFRLFGSTNDYMSTIIFQSILYAITGYLIYKIATLLFNRRIACIGFLMYVCLIWFSSYVAVPYTDSLVLVLPVALVYLYLKFKQTQLWRYYIMLCFVSMVGYKIKPQIMIVFIAISIICLLIEKFTVKQKMKLILISTITSISALVVVQSNINSLPYQLDVEKSFPMTHWLAMGHNVEKSGSYFHQDFSDNLDKVKSLNERKQLIEHRFKQRIKSLGILGILKLYRHKLMYSYNEGTFGSFFSGIGDAKQVNVARNYFDKSIQNIFRRDGKYFIKYANVVHSMWLIVIVCIFIGSLKRDISTFHALLMLILIGHVCFTLLFESASRYIFSRVVN